MEAGVWINNQKIDNCWNGFDLAHVLETGYDKFIEKCDGNEYLEKFKEAALKVSNCDKDYTWFYFENVIERLARQIFWKPDYESDEDNMYQNIDTKWQRQINCFAKSKNC